MRLEQEHFGPLIAFLGALNEPLVPGRPAPEMRKR